MNPTPTPKASWAGLLLILGAAALVGGGYLRSKAITDGLQAATTLVVFGGIGVALAISGITCAAWGARRGPRSATTRIAIALALIALAAIGAIAFVVIRKLQV